MDQVGVRALVGVFVAVSMVAACGADDGTDSAEYASLVAENELLAEDLDEATTEAEDARVELALAERRVDELDGEFAESEAEVQSVQSDFSDYLTVVFQRTGGLSENQSDCLAGALVDDPEARAAYLTLLSSTDPGSSEATAAYDSLGPIFDVCDLDLPGSEGDASASESPDVSQAFADALRPVEMSGTPLVTLPSGGSDPAIGLPAPVLVGEDYDGNAVRIDAAADGPTMVVLLAHWCPHCNAEIPRLNQLDELGRIPNGVNIVGVSTAINPSRANFPPDAWLDEMDWAFPVLADGIDPERDVFIGFDAFGVTGVPFVTLIDSDGSVFTRWAGERDPDAIVAELTALVASG